MTSPRYAGYGLQFLYEQHLQMADLAPNERILGLGVVSPTYGLFRFALEVRQVTQPTVTEHRYIPTVYTTIPLGGGFELRDRTRFEIRNVNRVYSERVVNRAAIGHDVDLFGVPLWTYGQFDLWYDSRYRTLNRIDKTIGTRVPLTSKSSLDTFLTRQDDTRRTPHTLLAVGALLRVAL